MGALIGGLGFGAISVLEGGSFADGASQGAKIGFGVGAIAGGIGAGGGFGLSEASGTIGSFISANATAFVMPAVLLPFTGEFKAEYSCGSYLSRCNNNDF